jgi:trehalose 2-sulfotransferase
LLTSLLESAGGGHPSEYFWREDIPSFKQRWASRRLASTWTAFSGLERPRNGVFAVKLMWGHLNDLFLYIRAYTGDYEGSDLAVLQRVFPNPRFVWLRREDVVGQAVSWWKAIQSGQWWAGQEGASGKPVYGFEQIDWLVNEIRVYDGCWLRWFQTERINPIMVSYADLCIDHEGVTRAVLAALGVEPVAGALIAPMDGLTKQADGINAEWVARYAEERRAAPSDL